MAELFYFMRKHAVDVLKYLPRFLSKEPTFKDAQDTLSTEHENLRVKLADLARQFFIETATWSMRDWEEFVGVKSASDLEGRRLRVKAKLLGGDVMTVANTNKLIRSFTAGERSYADESRGANVLKIVLRDRVLYWRELYDSIMELMPAHLWIEFERIFEQFLNLYAGFGHAKIGLEVIGLARPPDGRIDLSAGVGNGKFGTVTFGLAPPDILDNENRLNAGHVLIKSGVLTIGADMDDLYKLPEIHECAIADLLIADVGIARPSGVPIDRQDYSGFVGHVFIKQGTIKIGADLDDLGNKPWLINEHYSGFIGHAFIKQGTITIQADLSDLEGERWIRENGIADLLIADVGIARPMDVAPTPDEPEDDDAVPDGLWLRNYFDYPTGRDHPVLLANPRDDLTVADVRAVGKYAADNRVFINSKAESTLGIRKASLIHGYELMTADDDLKLPATGKIRLFFDFATGNHRKILLQERRDDLTVGDLKTFGAFTTSNRILMNARGEPSTGLTHAAVIRDFAINSLPDDTPIKF